MNFLTKIAIGAGLVMSLAAGPTQQNSTKQTYSTDIVLTSTNSVALNGAVMSNSVSDVLLKVRELDSATPSTDPIYLILNTPGGSIDAGISMIEQLNSMNRPVITITLFAASMGFQTVQGVHGKRYITENGTLMSHRPKGGFEGEFSATDGGGSQVNTRYEYYRERVARMDRKAVERSTKITYAQYETMIASEYWCDGQNCVDKGFADKVVTVMCDKSLNGTTRKTQTSSFFGMEMTSESESANCPLITGSPMGSLRQINGVAVYNEDTVLRAVNYNKDLARAVFVQFQVMQDSWHPSDFLKEYLEGTRKVINY